MSEEIRLIKKYPNRRLYDTATSSYITLADVKQLVLEQVLFKVVDAKTNEDLTRSILLQIILEEESAGAPMFSSDMLSQIIRFYGNAMQGMMGSYLEKNIQTFIEIQRRLQEQSLRQVRRQPDAERRSVEPVRQDAGPDDPGPDVELPRAERPAFLEMQQQLQKQARNLFGAFPFPQLRRLALRRRPEPRKIAEAGQRGVAGAKASERKELTPQAARAATARPRSVSSRSAARRRWSIPSTSSRSCAPRAT